MQSLVELLCVKSSNFLCAPDSLNDRTMLKLSSVHNWLSSWCKKALRRSTDARLAQILATVNVFNTELLLHRIHERLPGILKT